MAAATQTYYPASLQSTLRSLSIETLLELGKMELAVEPVDWIDSNAVVVSRA